MVWSFPLRPLHPTTGGEEDHSIHTLGTPYIHSIYALYIQSIQTLYISIFSIYTYYILFPLPHNIPPPQGGGGVPRPLGGGGGRGRYWCIYVCLSCAWISHHFWLKLACSPWIWPEESAPETSRLRCQAKKATLRWHLPMQAGIEKQSFNFWSL